jgi:hypothetical protein
LQNSSLVQPLFKQRSMRLSKTHRTQRSRKLSEQLERGWKRILNELLKAKTYKETLTYAITRRLWTDWIRNIWPSPEHEGQLRGPATRMSYQDRSFIVCMRF